MPDIGPSRTSGRSSSVHEALRRAAERVWEECSAGAAGVPEPDLLRQEIDGLADLVAATVDGAALPVPGPAETDTSALVDLLRRAYLRESDDGRDGASLRAVMLAFENVRPEAGEGAPLLPRPVVTPYARRLLREVAHTLRSPLGSIVMMAEILETGMGGSLNEAQRRQLRVIRRATLALAGFASDVLTLTGDDEPGTGRSAFSLPEVIGPVLDAVRPVAEEQHVTLRSEVADGATRTGRPDILGRIMLNILLHGARGARDGTLDLTARATRPERVEFAVTISGAGDPETLFRTFFADEAAGGYTVSAGGLGMCVARALVQRMGSDIDLARPAPGAVRLAFTLKLPPA